MTSVDSRRIELERAQAEVTAAIWAFDEIASGSRHIGLVFCVERLDTAIAQLQKSRAAFIAELRK